MNTYYTTKKLFYLITFAATALQAMEYKQIPTTAQEVVDIIRLEPNLDINLLVEHFFDLIEKRCKKLVSTIHANNFNVCHKLLKKRLVDPNTKTKDGCPTLVLAAENGYMDICNLLLEFGAKVDKDISIYAPHFESPLEHALKNHYFKGAQFLIDNGAPVDKLTLLRENLLIMFVSQGNREACKLLIKNKANISSLDVYSNTALILAAQNDNEEICLMIVDHIKNTEKTIRGLISFLGVLKYQRLHNKGLAKLLYKQRNCLVLPYFKKELSHCLPYYLNKFLLKTNKFGLCAYDYLQIDELKGHIEVIKPIEDIQEIGIIKLIEDIQEVEKIEVIEQNNNQDIVEGKQNKAPAHYMDTTRTKLIALSLILGFVIYYQALKQSKKTHYHHLTNSKEKLNDFYELYNDNSHATL